MAPLLRNLLLGFAVTAAAAARAQPLSVTYSPPAQKTPLGSAFVDWDSLSARYTPVGLIRAVFDAPTPTLEKFEVHVTTLRPGMASHQPHHHPWEELILVKDGDLEVSINGQRRHAGPGSLVFFASHDLHNSTNAGDKPATYFVINFVTDAVHNVPDQAAAARAVPGMLPSSVFDCDSLPATPTKFGFHCNVVDSPTLTFLRLESHVTTLNPGEGTTPGNRDPGDELFIVKSGVVEARISNVTCRMAAGSCFYVAPNDPRTFSNAGATPATYQVIKVVSERTPLKAGT
ncbi:MAG TPA: cupin domain-containing protein [Opitutaceae bacterium]